MWGRWFEYHRQNSARRLSPTGYQVVLKLVAPTLCHAPNLSQRRAPIRRCLRNDSGESNAFPRNQREGANTSV
jgi:hypothetical protein